MSWFQTVIDGGSEFENERIGKRETEVLPFIARPLLAQLIVAAAQIVALVRRQILDSGPTLRGGVLCLAAEDFASVDSCAEYSLSLWD